MNDPDNVPPQLPGDDGRQPIIIFLKHMKIEGVGDDAFALSQNSHMTFVKTPFGVFAYFPELNDETRKLDSLIRQIFGASGDNEATKALIAQLAVLPAVVQLAASVPPVAKLLADLNKLLAGEYPGQSTGRWPVVRLRGMSFAELGRATVLN